MYSMDSFVADFPREEEGEDTDDPMRVSPNTPYFSPSSTTTSGGADASDRAQIYTESVMQTINNISTSRKNSSDGGTGSDSVPPIPPTHAFFSAGYFDESDASDGSIVFNVQPPAPVNVPVSVVPMPAPKMGKHSNPKRDMTSRDRLPSFDSVGSSGSIRYLPPGSQKMPPQPPPASAHVVNINPQMLPYHERRKLMQQRQQQQQNAAPQRPEPTPPRPDAAPSRPMPYMMPPHPGDVNFYQQQQPYPGMHMPPPPHGNFPYYPAQGIPPHPSQGMHLQGIPMGMYPPPQGMPLGQYPPYPMQPPHGYPQPPGPVPRLSPYRTIGKTDPGSRAHQNTMAAPRRGYQPHFPPSSSLPPSGIQRPIPNLNSISRTRSSSFDSSTSHEKDAGAPLLSQRRAKDVPPPPPPPPPPLPPNYAHMRSDSTGSVSSLGSVIHTEGEDERQDKKRQQYQRKSETEGFFERLNPWSPKAPTVKDFHQKSQDFLKRNPNPPPVSMSPRAQQQRYVL
jgi:hypothetical protein